MFSFGTFGSEIIESKWCENQPSKLFQMLLTIPYFSFIGRRGRGKNANWVVQGNGQRTENCSQCVVLRQAKTTDGPRREGTVHHPWIGTLAIGVSFRCSIGGLKKPTYFSKRGEEQGDALLNTISLSSTSSNKIKSWQLSMEIHNNLSKIVLGFLCIQAKT